MKNDFFKLWRKDRAEALLAKENIFGKGLG